MVRVSREGIGVALAHPKHGMRITLDPAEQYDENDPLVKRYPWAFDLPVEKKVTKRTRAEKA